MTYPSHFSLQQSVYETLNNDATLAALVVGVFDHVPSGTDYPFITLGEGSARDWSNLEHQGTQHQVTLRVYSREAGRKQASTIIERIVALMHGGFSVSGQSVRSIRFLSSTIQLQDDGLTYVGTVNFRVLLSAA